MADSQVQAIIPLSQADLLAKYEEENWAAKFSPEHCENSDREKSFDKWRTSTAIHRKKFRNPVNGHSMTLREFMRDGKKHTVVLRLSDGVTTWTYNGIPLNS